MPARFLNAYDGIKGKYYTVFIINIIVKESDNNCLLEATHAVNLFLFKGDLDGINLCLHTLEKR